MSTREVAAPWTLIASLLNMPTRACLPARMAHGLPRSKRFLRVFPKALELLKTVGHTSTKLASLNETRVDEHYAMVRAQFVWRFEKAAAPPIDVKVDSTFILYIKDGVPRIVFQQEHEDFWQVLRTRGVLPTQG